MADLGSEFDSLSGPQKPSSLGDEFDQLTAKPQPSVNWGQVTRNWAQSNPITGPIADAWYSGGIVNTAAHAFGQSFNQNYGETDINPGLEDWLKKNGIYNDYKDGRTNVVKSANEAFMRPAIATFEGAVVNPVRAGLAALQGITAGGEAAGHQLMQAGQQFSEQHPGVIGSVVGGALGAPGELLAGTAEGFLPELHAPELHGLRAEGAIGESEGTFMGTKPLTPDLRVARNEAAARAGTSNEPGLDAHTVARANAPDTFKEWDALNAQQQTLRDKITEVGADDPAAKDARKSIQEIDLRKRDLAPDVAYAYRTAGEQLGSLYPSGADEGRFSSLEQPGEVFLPEGERSTPTGETPASEAPTGSAAPSTAEASATIPTSTTSETPPAKPSTYISDTVTKQLVNAGRPPEEAAAVAQVAQAYYETRADRLGKDSKELFDSEAPSITKGSSKKNNGALVLKAARNTMKIFKSANASTALHEFGHQFLEDLHKDASDPAASAETSLDHGIVAKWLKLKDGEDISVAQHEQFARGFEKFMMEGHAPSTGLARVFAKFRNWLTDIYKKVSKIPGVAINDDIRDVFSRMLSRDPSYDYTTIAEDVDDGSMDGSVPEDLRAPVSDEVTAKQAGDLATTPTPAGQPTSANDGIVLNQEKYLSKDGKPVLDNIKSDADLENFIRAFNDQNDQFNASRGRGLTDSQRIDNAEVFGRSTREMNRNLQKLAKLTSDSPISLATRVEALGLYMRSSADAAMKAALDGDVEKFNEVSMLQWEVQRAVAGVQTSWGQTGRALANIKVAAKQDEMLSQLLQSSTGRALADVRKDMECIKALDTPAKINAYMQALRKPSLGEMIQEAFKNYLISGPLTHMQYYLGNQLGTLMAAGPERFGSALVGDVREWWTGKGTKPEDKITYGEGIEGLHSFLFAQQDGLRAMGQSFMKGQTLNLPGEEGATTAFTPTKDIPNFENVGGTGVNIPLGSIIRAPGERMVAPIHSANRTINYLTFRSQLVYRKAVSEGLEPGTVDFATRQAELLKDTPTDIIKQARDQATEGALMGPGGKLTKWAQVVTGIEFDLPALGRTKPLGFVDPFVHVSGNIARMGILERSPLGLFAKTIRDDVTGKNGTLAMDTAIGKMGVGSAVWGGLGGLTVMKMLNGPAPDNYKEAGVWRMLNGLENSIRIGDMSFAFDRLGVYGSGMATAADFWTSTKYGYEQGSVKAGALQFLHDTYHHLGSEGFLSGFSDMFKAANDPDRYGDSWTNNMILNIAQPFSIGTRQIAQQVDPNQRVVHSFTDNLKSRVPLLSEDLEPKIDILGQPVPNKEFYGIYAQQVQSNPILQHMLDRGYFPSPVQPKIMGVGLTGEQHEAYGRIAGTTLAHLLQNLQNTPNWQAMPYKTLLNTIKDDIKQSRQSAQQTILARWPNIAKQAAQHKQDLAKGTDAP